MINESNSSFRTIHSRLPIHSFSVVSLGIAYEGDPPVVDGRGTIEYAIRKRLANMDLGQRTSVRTGQKVSVRIGNWAVDISKHSVCWSKLAIFCDLNGGKQSHLSLVKGGTVRRTISF